MHARCLLFATFLSHITQEIQRVLSTTYLHMRAWLVISTIFSKTKDSSTPDVIFARTTLCMLARYLLSSRVRLFVCLFGQPELYQNGYT